ncbi:alpha/beta hydrolase family protein [Aquimonas sp.]|uniref:alpha/beta hydrolase family protein n=1 Tax=Aquimonas sp. TaxID=1872588 RepID=UPI0037BE6997
MSTLIPAQAESLDLDVFLKRGAYGEIRLSPDGRHLAATYAMPDREILVLIRREDMQPVARVAGAEHSAVAGFKWLDNQRVLVSAAERFGDLDTPLATGELHLVSTDGSSPRLLFQRYPAESESSNANRGQARTYRTAQLIDTLPADADRILIEVVEWTGANPLSRIERLVLDNGRRRLVMSAPVRSATVRTDPSGEPRLAYGFADGTSSRLFARQPGDSEWRLLNDQAQSGRDEFPLGFSPDGARAYLSVTAAQGSSSIAAWNPGDDSRIELARDQRVDPAEAVLDANGSVIGVAFHGERRRIQFFEPDHVDARLQATLQRSFANSDVYLHPAPVDAPIRLFEVRSDRDPGSFFLYDTVAKRATFLNSRLPGIDPEQMAATRAVDITARDGLLLQGLLTRPRDAAESQALPLVLLPHGGPFGVYDRIDFNPEVQMLAAAGYAVLQVNYRGSGNFGAEFQRAGARQWGGTMQDDLTDATRWALEQGIAAPDRICIVGASYGAYAALMGLVREPELYACAVGYVGVFDLALMVRDEKGTGRRNLAWHQEWVGDASELGAVSPTELAERIQAPVLLAAGGEDRIAPIEHSRRMARALNKRDAEVETYYVDTAGHGFHLLEHRREYYRRMLDFLQRHLGAAVQPD